MARAPLHIDELHIQSFRGIDDLRVRFPHEEDETGGVSVFAGDNGCGKTAVLEAVLLVLGKRDLLPEDSGPLDEQIAFGADDFAIEAVVREGDSAPTQVRVDNAILREGDPGLKFPSHDDRVRLAWSKIQALDAKVQYFSARREPEALGETPEARGARSTREARRVVELKKRLVNTYYRSLKAGKDGKMPEDSPFNRLQTFVQRFLGQDRFLDVIAKNNEEGGDFEVVIRDGEMIPASVTSLAMARRLAAEGKPVPRLVPIDRLSSGQIELFAFAGPLVLRDAPADIVIIDEPEKHMHVQWQRHILTALRELSPESHFIVATHSLDVLDSALRGERFFLGRADDPRVVADEAAE